MSVDKNEVLKALSRLQLPDGGDLVSKDFIRAVTVHAGSVRFVIEAPSPEIAKKLAAIREQHGDNKEKLGQEMMALYKKEKINPLGG